MEGEEEEWIEEGGDRSNYGEEGDHQVRFLCWLMLSRS